jgi:hypothetical protein
MSKKLASKNLFWASSMLSLVALGVFTQPSTANNIKVTCDTDSPTPMVKASFFKNNSSKNITVLNLLPEYFSPSEAVQNCQDAASRLQSLYDMGSGNYLTTEDINGTPAVCAVKRRGTGCDHYGSRVLFTLKKKDNPSQALYNMLGSDLKQFSPLNSRTLGRIYADIKPSFWQRLWYK